MSKIDLETVKAVRVDPYVPIWVKRFPRRAGLAQSLESYARCLGVSVDRARPGWVLWGYYFLGIDPGDGDLAVPIEWYPPAVVFSEDEVPELGAPYAEAWA